jgi:hypothetical protein
VNIGENIKANSFFACANYIRIIIRTSFIHQWLYSPLLGPGLFFSFVFFSTQTVEHLGLDQPGARPLPTHRTTQHRISAHTDIHALSGIGTHDPSVRASEDSSCLKPRGHRYQLSPSSSSYYPSNSIRNIDLRYLHVRVSVHNTFHR